MPYAVSTSDCYLIRIHVEVGLCFFGSFEDNLTVFTLWTLVPKTLLQTYRSVILLAGVIVMWSPKSKNLTSASDSLQLCATCWLHSLLSFLLQLLFVQSPSPVFSIAVFSQELVEPSLPTPSNRRRKCISRGNSGHQAMVRFVAQVPLEFYGNICLQNHSLETVSAGVCWNMSWANRLFKRFCFCSWCLLGRGWAYSGRFSECRTSFTRWNWGFSCRNSGQIGCGNHGKWIPKLVK